MTREPILVVDDNPMNRKLTRLILELEGYQVETAVDAQDALEILRHYRPQLILVDFQMPGKDGVALTRHLRRDPDYQEIKIIILTSYDLKGEEEKARAAGCDAYLTKPIDTNTLPLVIAQYLRRDGTSPQGADGADGHPSSNEKEGEGHDRHD